MRCWLLILIVIATNQAIDIYIDSVGLDFPDCGNETNPCGTLYHGSSFMEQIINDATFAEITFHINGQNITQITNAINNNITYNPCTSAPINTIINRDYSITYNFNTSSIDSMNDWYPKYVCDSNTNPYNNKYIFDFIVNNTIDSWIVNRVTINNLIIDNYVFGNLIDMNLHGIISYQRDTILANGESHVTMNGLNIQNVYVSIDKPFTGIFDTIANLYHLYLTFQTSYFDNITCETISPVMFQENNPIYIFMQAEYIIITDAVFTDINLDELVLKSYGMLIQYSTFNYIYANNVFYYNSHSNAQTKFEALELRIWNSYLLNIYTRISLIFSTDVITSVDNKVGDEVEIIQSEFVINSGCLIKLDDERAAGLVPWDYYFYETNITTNQLFSTNQHLIDINVNPNAVPMLGLRFRNLRYNYIFDPLDILKICDCYLYNGGNIKCDCQPPIGLFNNKAYTVMVDTYFSINIDNATMQYIRQLLSAAAGIPISDILENKSWFRLEWMKFSTGFGIINNNNELYMDGMYINNGIYWGKTFIKNGGYLELNNVNNLNMEMEWDVSIDKNNWFYSNAFKGFYLIESSSLS
eukprot:468354_1